MASIGTPIGTPRPFPPLTLKITFQRHFEEGLMGKRRGVPIAMAYQVLGRFPGGNRVCLAKAFVCSPFRPGISSPKEYSKSWREQREYLHRSKVPTYKFQPSLEPLPIPKLEDTCARYLNSLRPLLNDEELERSKKFVDEFKNSAQAQETHNFLVNRYTVEEYKNFTSYVSEPWFDKYLRGRHSVVLNDNPFMSFKDDPKKDYNSQLIRTTNMIISSVRFMKTLREEILKPMVYSMKFTDIDRHTRFWTVMSMLPSFQRLDYGLAIKFYKVYPLDMSQFKNLFNSTRIPCPEKDELRSDPTANHLLVMRNGHFYVFNVLDDNGYIVPHTDILSNIQYILNDPSPPPDHGVGVLSFEDRNTWAGVRQQLEAAGNEDAMKLIDSAIFALCLDNESPTDPTEVSRLFLHGNGYNRWFDKSFSLLIARNGKAAVNFEHSWGDGVAVMRYFNDVFADSINKPAVQPDTQPSIVDPSTTVKKLEFKLTDQLKQSIKDAQSKFDQAVGNVDFANCQVETFGKDDLQRKWLSTDSIMQLSFQLALYRQYGIFEGVYESCSTSAFKFGRTETLRSCTPETKAACIMLEKSTNRNSIQDMQDMQDMVKKCSNVHKKLTRNAAMGQGWDRHLFAIKYWIEKNGQDLPALYTDPAYAKINHNILSTSTLDSKAVEMGGFAPVVPDGYGVGYMTDANRVGCNVTCYKDSNRDVQQFVACVKQSLEDIYQICKGIDNVSSFSSLWPVLNKV